MGGFHSRLKEKNTSRWHFCILLRVQRERENTQSPYPSTYPQAKSNSTAKLNQTHLLLVDIASAACFGSSTTQPTDTASIIISISMRLCVIRLSHTKYSMWHSFPPPPRPVHPRSDLLTHQSWNQAKLQVFMVDVVIRVDMAGS